MVTTVMAGIIFAAMVPLFVAAEQKSAGDQMREIATNLAQDRIEKIRSLPYNQITLDHLQSSTYAGGQFGTTWISQMGGGAKTFTIAYFLNPPTGGAATNGSTPDHLRVTVQVSWMGNPTPHKMVQLDTVISKQYAGPPINSLTVSPSDSATHLTVTGKPITLTAVVPSSFVAGMNPNGYVQFNIIPLGTGITPPSPLEVDFASATAGNTTYSATWNPDLTAYPDGQYSFTAQAFSSGGDPGHPVQQVLTLQLSNAPPKVTGLTASPGDGRVVLGWTACSSTDFDHYEIWRGTTAGTEALYVDNLTANSYIDTGLVNDDTYFYRVYALDHDGNKSPASDEISATPTNQPNNDRPTAPGNFAGTANLNTAVLSWTAATDGDDGVAGYYIYRDGGTTPYASVPAGSLGMTDTIGWSSTHTYQVRAYDAGGRLSPWTSVVSVTTGTRPGPFTLTITRNQKNAVTVVTATDPAYNSGNLTGAKTKTVSGLYYGVYTITSTYTGKPANIQTITLNGNTTVTVNF
jgi:fibronectin type 3 domain-containing protein